MMYSTCGDGDSMTVHNSTGSTSYDLWCPCYDAAGSNTNLQSTLPALSTPPCTPPTLFFSQYQGLLTVNKFLQIYNPTSTSIALAEYAFPSVSNAPTTPGTHEFWNTFTAGASIAPGGFYTICHPQADAGIAPCDQTHMYLSNGDDGYCLAHGSESSHTLIDCIGDFMGDPGSRWNVCGPNSGMTTQNHHLLRDPSTCFGDPTGLMFDGITTPTSCPWSRLPMAPLSRQ